MQHLAFIWVIPAVVTSLDQWTKYLISSQLSLGEKISVIPAFFHIVSVRNTGAAWGIFAGQKLWLAGASIIILILLVCFHRTLTGKYPERALALSLLISGILGNLIDRIFRADGVVDFLSFSVYTFEWPAFNIADSTICIGVGLYIISSFLRDQPLTIQPTLS